MLCESLFCGPKKVCRRETTLDARGLLVRQRRGASERVALVSPLRDSAPLNFVAPNEKKTSGTQGIERHERMVHFVKFVIRETNRELGDLDQGS